MTAEDDGRSPNYLTKKWSIIAAACSLLVLILVTQFSDPGRGQAAGCGSCAIILAARSRWDLGRRVWFWGVLILIVAIHMPLILFVPWTNSQIPAVGLLPFVFVDYAIILGSFKLMEMAMRRFG